MHMPNLTRRGFGTLALGGSTYLLLGGCGRGIEALSPGVAPVGHVGTWNDGLPRSAPEAQGVSSQAILDFLRDVGRDNLELHSFMLMRGGQVIAEAWWWPYQPHRVHMTHSLTKSVTAVGVGLAIDEGKFGLDDRVVSFFPEHVPADASENMRAMTVRDLLTMEAGHDRETSGSLWRPIKTSWIREFFKIPVPHKPGTVFKYTSAASFMLSAIVSRTTGQKLSDYLKPRFLEPLGIRKLNWDVGPEDISTGGNGLSWTTDASLKLGAVHAANGRWNGQQILSEQWVRAATTRQSGDAEDDYGYHWWMGPGRSYYALGLFTQLAVVFPEHDATLAVFAAIDGSSKLKPHIWKHFPSAFAPAALPPSTAAAELRRRTADLRLLQPLSGRRSPVERTAGRRFRMAGNDQSVAWVEFDFAGDACSYRMADARGEHRIVAGFTDYLEQATSMTGGRLHHEYEPDGALVVAGAEWTAPDTLKMTWQFAESAFRDTVICRFAGDSVRIDRSVNLNSAETRLPTLTGQAT